MPHILIKNSLSNLKAAKLNINIPSFVSVRSGGDPKWFLEIATTYPSVSGTNIAPVYIDSTLNFDEIDEAVATAVSNIAAQIDWGELELDDAAPYIIKNYPVGEAVSIASNIIIELKDDIPSAGIDLSDVEVILNTGGVDLDITSECFIEGTPFNYVIRWEPSDRKYSYYMED